MQESVTITVSVPDRKLPLETASVLSKEGIEWTLTNSAEVQIELSDLLGTNWGANWGANCDDQNVLKVADSLESAGFSLRWRSFSRAANHHYKDKTESSRPFYNWPREPAVLAVVPHWQCERWLGRCLRSLTHQTHPLTNIVVIDDGSDVPPLEIVKAFAQVTLLASPLSQQVGPYRLVQSVIANTDYTAFLFQDADDWSVCDRLQTLLATARAHSADITGSQEIRVIEPERCLQTVGYPVNVNAAMAHAPGHGLLHPTSLVTQHILQKVGGFATGLRFGADSEFLLRAHWIARTVNSPRYCYFRRKRPKSLTTAQQTGLESPERIKLTSKIKEKAIERAQAIKNGERPDLSPLSVMPLIELEHLLGPKLRWR